MAKKKPAAKRAAPAKRKAAPKRKRTKNQVVPPPKRRGRPRNVDLPGMEDSAIKPLEDMGAAYADIRDQRIELNREEASLKQGTIKLMHRYGKTIYRRDGITIRLVEGDEDVKIQVKPHADEGIPAGGGGEFAEERAAAVEDEGDPTGAEAGD